MGCAAACNDSPCVTLPCPESLAAEISVTANNAPTGIAGLTVSAAGSTTTIPCSQGSGPTTVCWILGAPGVYHLTLSAPGYQSVPLTFSVTGTAGGCNSCGHADTQTLSVVLQPGSV
jgi:hypothetical protein